MTKKKQHLEMIDLSLICNRKLCKFEIGGIRYKDIAKWLNKPCPKCGDNLLTMKDFDRMVYVKQIQNLVNSLTLKQLSLLGLEKRKKSNKKSIITVNTHKKISVHINQ